jgi:signal transduction histidine kinase
MRIQVDRLERLMENLLTLGRPIRKSSMQPTMVREMIDEAIDIWNTRIDQRTQSVAAYIDPQVGGNTVLVDDGTMQQVIANLLDNANEHSPDDTGVEMRVEKAAERLVRIRVIDKGPGVSPEILRRIFEPFYTTRKAGTGLGLSIVHHVVDSHGGTVRLYNNDPGPGVTAEILLPLVVRRSTKSS